MEKFTYTAYGKFGDDFSYRTEAMQHKWTAGMTAVQHYCAATGAVIDPMTLGWQGDTYKIKLGNGKDVVLELGFCNRQGNFKISGLIIQYHIAKAPVNCLFVQGDFYLYP